MQLQTRNLGDYAAMGIREIWVIDPGAGAFSRFEDGQPVRRECVTVSDRGIDFQVSEIARLLN